MKRSKIFKLLLTALIFFSIEKLTRTQTHGFREEKTCVDFPTEQRWELEESPLPKILEKPFTFLGSGVQFYAFLSEDKTTVLKVFKHYHFGFKSSLLRHFPFTKRPIEKRKNRIDKLFSSALLAYTEMSKETGVTFLSLNPKPHHPRITVYDNIGIKRTLPLDKTPFLLQKKATPLLIYLNAHPREAPHLLRSVFSLFERHQQFHIYNTDPRIEKNFGVSDGEVIEIDIGSFTKTSPICPSLFHKRMAPLKKWIEKNCPELDDVWKEKMEQKWEE